mgnify:CR=1 FL=1
MNREIVSAHKTSNQCKVCTFKDKDGILMRERIEGMYGQGVIIAKIQEWLANQDKYASMNSIAAHFRKHSPHIIRPRKTITRIITTFTHTQLDVQKALNKIINIGDKMVDNWWERVEGPQMPVTERMYMKALEEEGKRAPKTSIDQELDMMEKLAIEKHGHNPQNIS